MQVLLGTKCSGQMPKELSEMSQIVWWIWKISSIINLTYMKWGPKKQCRICVEKPVYINVMCCLRHLYSRRERRKKRTITSWYGLVVLIWRGWWLETESCFQLSMSEPLKRYYTGNSCISAKAFCSEVPSKTIMEPHHWNVKRMMSIDPFNNLCTVSLTLCCQWEIPIRTINHQRNSMAY